MHWIQTMSVLFINHNNNEKTIYCNQDTETETKTV